MNKLNIDTKEFYKDIDNDYEIEINKDLDINLKIIKDSNILILVKNSNVKIKIELLDNIKLVINQLGIDSSVDYDIIVNNNSNLMIVDSILTKVDSINNINIIHKGNNSLTNFYTNGINLDKNKLYFNLNGVIEKNSLNSELNENSKIINIKDGDSLIIPNLIVDTKEVIANHSAFIGTFSIDDLYYLMSRGISKKNSKNLLIKSILLSKMNLEKDNFIKEITTNCEGGLDE